MPDEHESCKQIRPASHTTALGGLFIADEWAGAQEKVYEVDSRALLDRCSKHNRHSRNAGGDRQPSHGVGSRQ